jgi:hypothetical protein
MHTVTQPDTFLRYAAMFVGKTNGERWVQTTNSQLTPHDAMADAREHRADGYEIVSLVEIDMLTGIPRTLQNRQQLTVLFDNEEQDRDAAERDADDEDTEYHSFAQQMRGWGAAL